MKNSQGLNLELSVNDDGTGLKKGVKEAFPGIQMQSDVFHGQRELILGVIMLERTAYKAIRNQYDLKEKCLKAFMKGKDKYLDKYEKSQEQANKAIEAYDRAYILSNWIKEALQKGGYSYEERTYILNYALEQLSLLPKTNAYMEKGIKYISGHQEALLHFVQVGVEAMKQLANDQGVDLTALELMWQQLQYTHDSIQYNILESHIGNLLKNQYALIREKFQELMDKLVRASSIVECINSLIRPYLFLKRIVGARFLDILQCYFNTRVYHRSRVDARVGKSPIELLTGQAYPDFFKILGY